MRYLELLCWLLPASRLKNRILKGFGRNVHPSARIAPNLVFGVRDVIIGRDAYVAVGNVFRGLSLLQLDDETDIGSWNWISAHPIYQGIDPRAGTLFLGFRARIGSRCYIDASGTVVLRALSSLGGNRVTVQTHEPVLTTAVQTVGRVELGEAGLVSSNTVLLQGAVLPAHSVLAAHGTLLAPRADDEMKPGVYVGTPAKWKADIDGVWFNRDFREIGEHRVVSEQGVSDADRERPEQVRER